MAALRTILALAIAASVALLPAAKAGALPVKPADMSAAAAMSTPDTTDAASPDRMSPDAMADEMPDCCPKANPCSKPIDDCASMAGCALKCFGFSGLSFAHVVLPSRLGGSLPLVASEPVRAQRGSPPFRPPRV